MRQEFNVAGTGCLTKKKKKREKKKETANEGCTALGSHFKSKTFGLHMSLGVGYIASDQCKKHGPCIAMCSSYKCIMYKRACKANT